MQWLTENLFHKNMIYIVPSKQQVWQVPSSITFFQVKMLACEFHPLGELHEVYQAFLEGSGHDMT